MDIKMMISNRIIAHHFDETVMSFHTLIFFFWPEFCLHFHPPLGLIQFSFLLKFLTAEKEGESSIRESGKSKGI